MSKTHAFVFARGGSKGLPRKNLLTIAGLPLIAHGIQLAHKLKDVEHVFISTDSSDIAEIGVAYGAELIERPAELASDSAPEWLAWQHSIRTVQERYGSFERFLSLPATAPLRILEDVERCLDALRPDIDLVITMAAAHRSPWFNMVTVGSEGNVKLVAIDGDVQRRQDAPVCFDVTTVAYVARTQFILQASNMWQGSVAGVEIPVQRSIDIDTQLDFDIARFLMEQWKPTS